MKFNTLIIENFLSIGKIRVSLKSKGLVLIQGENLDDTSQSSNGSGKSSVPDALSWCLYGYTARGVTGDAVINKSATECRVLVEIEDGTDLYNIERTRGVSSGLYVETMTPTSGGWKDLTLGTTKLTQELVVGLVGCSREVFEAAVYAGQEKMPDLPGMTDTTLKVLVEEAAGISVINRAYGFSRLEKNVITHDLDLVKIGVKSDADAIHSRTKELKDAIIDDVAYEKGRQLGLDHLRDRGQEVKQKIIDLNIEIRGIDLPELENELETTEITIRNALSEDEGKISVLEKNSFETAESCRQIYAKLKGAVRKVDDLLKPASLEKCSECDRPFEEQDYEAIEIRRVVDLKAAKDNRDVLHSMHISLGNELGDAQQELSDAKDNRVDVADLLESQNAIEEKIQTAAALSRRKVNEIDNIKRVVREIKDTKAALNPHKSNRMRNEQVLENLTASHKILTTELDTLTKRKFAIEGSIRVLGPGGVRAHMLDTVTPFLNKQTNLYLSDLTDGNVSARWQTLTENSKGLFKEKFSIEVESKVGAGNFKSLSGGEKRKVRLACSMALQDLVASRASKPIDLFIADEIDDALDDRGLERLMGILDKKARDKGTVLIISHNSLSDWIRETVTVIKEGGISRLEGSALNG